MLIVLVHGWSVHNTNTYGELPERLVEESKLGNLPPPQFQHVWLSKYVSFRDEVRVPDLADAFEAAFQDRIRPLLAKNERFFCITHSTGGPIVRHWWQKKYWTSHTFCPMSHLVMLAPPNFGSALAQLGKGRLSRLRSWLKEVEPGMGVLDWLEHGSWEAWELNRNWIEESQRQNPAADTPPFFQFVLAGQAIDRQLYDHVNSYTGESGSDGTVRVAAANLNARYIQLEQTVTKNDVTDIAKTVAAKGGIQFIDPDRDFAPASNVAVTKTFTAAPTAFRLIENASHTGEQNGILFSIRRDGPHPTVDAIIRCLKISTFKTYEALRAEFLQENEGIRRRERVEEVKGLFRNQYYFHDAHTLLILRFRDDRGYPLADFDFKLTGRQDSPDGLPPGFFVDRQQNRYDRGMLTYYLNHDIINGLGPLRNKKQLIRRGSPRLDRLGFRVYAYPMTGFVRYLPAVLQADAQQFANFVRPDETTMVDVILRRVVFRGAFLKVESNKGPELGDFRGQEPGEPLL
jgi:hypothetical protein